MGTKELIIDSVGEVSKLLIKVKYLESIGSVFEIYSLLEEAGEITVKVIELCKHYKDDEEVDHVLMPAIKLLNNTIELKKRKIACWLA